MDRELKEELDRIDRVNEWRYKEEKRLRSYKSSVLTSHAADDDDDDDQGCLVCSFLSGDTSETTLLKVIKILDAKLADRENVLTLLAINAQP